MKPVVIIAISVVCSVVAVLGVTIALNLFNVHPFESTEMTDLITKEKEKKQLEHNLLISQIGANQVAELEDLKKLIPENYDYNEKATIRDSYGNPSNTKNTVILYAGMWDGGNKEGGVIIQKFKNKNDMWDGLKNQRENSKLVEVTDLPASCYSRIDQYETFYSLTCIKDNLLITVNTNYGDTKTVMKQILSKF